MHTSINILPILDAVKRVLGFLPEGAQVQVGLVVLKEEALGSAIQFGSKYCSKCLKCELSFKTSGK